VCQFIKKAFARGYIDPHFAETLMLFIPEVYNPNSFKEFRAISLCNVNYKLVSKVLVSHIRPILKEIVSSL